MHLQMSEMYNMLTKSDRFKLYILADWFASFVFVPEFVSELLRAGVTYTTDSYG